MFCLLPVVQWVLLERGRPTLRTVGLEGPTLQTLSSNCGFGEAHSLNLLLKFSHPLLKSSNLTLKRLCSEMAAARGGIWRRPPFGEHCANKLQLLHSARFSQLLLLKWPLTLNERRGRLAAALFPGGRCLHYCDVGLHCLLHCCCSSTVDLCYPPQLST